MISMPGEDEAFGSLGAVRPRPEAGSGSGSDLIEHLLSMSVGGAPAVQDAPSRMLYVRHVPADVRDDEIREMFQVQPSGRVWVEEDAGVGSTVMRERVQVVQDDAAVNESDAGACLDSTGSGA